MTRQSTASESPPDDMCSDECERTRVDEIVDVSAATDEASLDVAVDMMNEPGVKATVDETANADASTTISADIVGLMFAALKCAGILIVGFLCVEATKPRIESMLKLARGASVHYVPYYA